MLANPGDSLVESWTTLENGCGYQVVYRRVDGGDLPTVKLFSVESTGQSPGLNGGRRRVSIMLKSLKTINNAIAFGGDAIFGGNPTILGPCSDIHTNGDALFSGTATVDGNVSASGTANVAGVLLDALGDTVTATSAVPENQIPDLDPMDYCSEADYIFEDQWGTQVATGTTRNLNVAWWGWKYTSGRYITDSADVMPGVYCMNHDAELTNQIGSADDPLSITILTTGSVTMPGDPYAVAAPPDSILIMAEGDVNIRGDPVAGDVGFQGLIYAGSQCQISGAPVIYGQIICRDDPNPVGTTDYASTNSISGDLQLTYSCGGILSPRPPTPLTQRMWSHVW